MVSGFRFPLVPIVILAASGAIAGETGRSGAPTTLRVVGGRLAAEAITPENARLSAGKVPFQMKSTFSANTLLGVTPNWGDRTTSYIDVGNFSTSAAVAKNMSLTAPLTPGTYWIVAVAGNEDSVSTILTGSSRFAGNPVWNDGNDVADWPLATIQAAVVSGTVQAPELYSSGMGWASIAATATQVTPRCSVSTVASGGAEPTGVSSLSLELGHSQQSSQRTTMGTAMLPVANQSRAYSPGALLDRSPLCRIATVIQNQIPQKET